MNVPRKVGIVVCLTFVVRKRVVFFVGAKGRSGSGGVGCRGGLVLRVYFPDEDVSICE